MRKNRSVRVTLYLPEDLRERAREAGLNLSALLRHAVEEELRRDPRAPTVSVERVDDLIDVHVRFPVDP